MYLILPDGVILPFGYKARKRHKAKTVKRGERNVSPPSQNVGVIKNKVCFFEKLKGVDFSGEIPNPSKRRG